MTGGQFGGLASSDALPVTMTAVVDVLVDAIPSLRERKKQRTRATLVNAAVKLCLKQGYEHTTVDQIASAAEVSPRTFSRYFATKDAVYLSLLEALVDAVAAELVRLPAELSPLRALRDAHIIVLDRVRSGAVPGLTPEGVALGLRVINSTSVLKTAAAELESPSVMAALAARMGEPAGSRRLRLVNSVWSAIIVSGCGDLVTDGDDALLGPELMTERIAASYDSLTALLAPLH